MNIDHIAFIVLLGFGIIAFLYLLGCEDEENTILNEYSEEGWTMIELTYDSMIAVLFCIALIAIVTFAYRLESSR